MMKSIGSRFNERPDPLGRVRLLERLVVEDEIAVRRADLPRPLGGQGCGEGAAHSGSNVFGRHDAIGEDVPDRPPPTLDDAVRATDDGELAADHAGSEDRRERLAGPGARPVADTLPLSDANGEMPLHQVRQGRLAVDVEGVAVRNGKVLSLAILLKEPGPDLLGVSLALERLRPAPRPRLRPGRRASISWPARRRSGIRRPLRPRN